MPPPQESAEASQRLELDHETVRRIDSLARMDQEHEDARRQRLEHSEREQDHHRAQQTETVDEKAQGEYVAQEDAALAWFQSDAAAQAWRIHARLEPMPASIHLSPQADHHDQRHAERLADIRADERRAPAHSAASAPYASPETTAPQDLMLEEERAWLYQQSVNRDINAAKTVYLWPAEPSEAREQEHWRTDPARLPTEAVADPARRWGAPQADAASLAMLRAAPVTPPIYWNPFDRGQPMHDPELAQIWGAIQTRDAASMDAAMNRLLDSPDAKALDNAVGAWMEAEDLEKLRRETAMKLVHEPPPMAPELPSRGRVMEMAHSLPPPQAIWSFSDSGYSGGDGGGGGGDGG